MDTKQLRQKILDLAIRGKLVPQDPNDEPASVLLERVKAEKERLIAEGKIKRSKKSASSSDKPHYADWDLPSGWVWVRLDEICEIKGGKRIPRGMKLTDNVTSHIYIRVTDMKDCSVDMSGLKYITDEIYDFIRNYTISANDLYITIAGSIGRVGEIPKELHNANLTENAAKLTNIICDKKFLMYALLSDIAQSHFTSRFHQVAQPKLSIETASCTLIPLPPLNEQARIVNEIDHLFATIKDIDKSTFELSSAISQVKSKILELAINGKLVPQDPADEPAEILLQRINPNAVVSTDTSHYNGQNLPNGWIQCKFSDLFNVRSARRVHKADWRSEGIPFYRAREIGKLSDLGTVDNDLYIDNLLYSEFAKSGVPQSGDIMITAVGTLGKTYIVRKGDKFYYKDGSVLCIENRNGIDPRYIEMFISSSHFKEQYIWESQGTTVATLTMDRINSYSFVLPPLNEQKRIVSKVDELFAVIDQIKQSLE